MAAISGKDGTINGDGDKIKSFTITYETDQLDSTSMGSNGYREYTDGLIGATTTITATEKITIGSTLNLNSGANTYSGSVKSTSEVMEVPVDGLVMFTQNVNFHGSIAVS